MAKVRVTVPIRLTVDAEVLHDGAARVDLAAKLLAIVEHHWLVSQHTLRDHGHRGEPRVASVTFGWSGPSLPHVSSEARAVVEHQLRRVIEAATTRIVPPGPPREWTHVRLPFAARFGELVRVLRDHVGARGGELQVRYRTLWDEPVAAQAWVVTVREPVSWARLQRDFEERRTRTCGADALFGWLGDGVRVEELRALDRGALRALPGLDAAAAVVDPGTVAPGTRLVFVAATLPQPATSTTAPPLATPAMSTSISRRPSSCATCLQRDHRW